MSGRQAFPPRDMTEARKILREIDQENPIVALQLELMALTGLRYCDASKLKPSDLFINGVIRSTVIIIQQKIYSKLRQMGKSETEARRRAKVTIVISEQCREVIEDAMRINAGTVMLFESSVRPGQPYTCQYINKLMRKVATKLQLPYQLSTHSWRKLFAKALVENNASIHQVRDSLGQASLSSTDHYLSTFLSDAEKLVSGIRF